MDKDTREWSHVTLKAGRLLHTGDAKTEKRLKFWRIMGKRIEY